MLKCIDLFSGAGGLSLGLSFSRFESVIAVEIEKDFAETYKINHPKTMVLQKSISDVNSFSDILYTSCMYFDNSGNFLSKSFNHPPYSSQYANTNRQGYL